MALSLVKRDEDRTTAWPKPSVRCSGGRPRKSEPHTNSFLPSLYADPSLLFTLSYPLDTILLRQTPTARKKREVRHETHVRRVY